MVLVQSVSKRYRLYPRPMDRLHELVTDSRCCHTDFWPLRDINFQVDRGETLGVVGLAVGDAVFANRCVRKCQELGERKITVLFVSHDLGLVKLLSDQTILPLDGRIEAEGAPNEVINR